MILKPVFIIAIAVACSVVAVLGVLVGLEQIATIQAQQAYDEYTERVHQQQMIIVNAYNVEINRCSTVFEYGNVLAKEQCEKNAENDFEIYKLDPTHTRMLESPFISGERLEHSQKILDKMTSWNHFDEFSGCIYDVDKGGQYYIDRYNNELTYKKWFDERFYTLTIEDAVQYSESTGSLGSLTNAEQNSIFWKCP
ncbi:MAG: hypothetical protein M8317_02910 [Nitrosopumilus sp.]|nr:hypothetical protein [Nitrosopumilus sp.]